MPHRSSTALLTSALWAGVLSAAQAQTPSEGEDPILAAWAPKLQSLAREGAQQAASGKARIEVQVGRLDPRLKLAPCEKIEPYLPPHQPAWGRTRIGLRCAQGPKLWNVSLPVTVQVWMPAVVAQSTLPMGTVLEARHLHVDEVDIAAAPGVALTKPEQAVGRTLQRALASGEAVRLGDLKSRQFFAAGDNVKVIASGPGWRIATEGQALSAGLEGQPVKVRVESGRTLQGRVLGDREVEVGL